MAREFVRRSLPRASIIDLDLQDRVLSDSIGVRADGAEALGFLTAGSNITDHQFMQHVARALQLERPEIPVVVIGRAIDDLDLMKTDNVFVTGPVGDADLGRVLRQYGIKGLFAATRRPLFGHPVMAAVAGRRDFPLARFDWSFGRIPADPIDLALDPGATAPQVAYAMQRWFCRL
jgi:hypothetical protein